MNRFLLSLRRLSSASGAFVTALAVSACGSADAPNIPSNPAVEVYASSLGVSIATMTKKSDNLYTQDLVVGTGVEAIAGRTVGVTYSGYLINGSRFDSNVGGTVFSFTLGVGQVIAGWDLGVAGMRVGGKRKLVIGSSFGYGAQGSGPIPANATLVFDVEVLSVR